MVPGAGVTGIHLPMPKIRVLRVLGHEVLHGEECGAIDAMDRKVEVERVVEGRVKQSHLRLGPEGGEVGEFRGDRGTKGVGVVGWGCEDRDRIILHVDEYMNRIFAVSKQRQLGDDGA